MTVRFVGTRVGAEGTDDARDRFEQTERVDGLAAGTGPVALTTRVSGINAGEWRVTASPVTRPGATPAVTGLSRRVITTKTVFGQLAQGPAVRLAAWPLLVGLGAVVAIALQALLAARVGINVAAVLAVSLVGCLLGFVGGKVWYLVLHRRHPRTFLTAGACIQGFLVVALGVIALGAALLRLPPGTLLDVTTPGVFFGMALGRPGCFLTGCCAGRPTSSRWGLRSSDRRLAIRRCPVQLLEATAALAIGVVSLALVLAAPPPLPGAIFVGSLAAYTFCRQLLFPFRTESRTSRGRTVTMVASGLVLVGVVGVSGLL
ncbi:phosphatidylglycerol:prolipoprotein diacylglycerol transferase [Amycolatopsis marina]|uniref:Phosphatidylglycerol:prolipoprotein diacylglycerol transferase n=2 Tax=Amycolatopsis marina TaxID=490629 RepID=A0A1I1CNU3_9PSEU|nr:phosphatidylglycerol:prolipoprotein diacylglycerol transferase [Amycolatopsis marina]